MFESTLQHRGRDGLVVVEMLDGTQPRELDTGPDQLVAGNEIAQRGVKVSQGKRAPLEIGEAFEPAVLPGDEDRAGDRLAVPVQWPHQGHRAELTMGVEVANHLQVRNVSHSRLEHAQGSLGSGVEQTAAHVRRVRGQVIHEWLPIPRSNHEDVWMHEGHVEESPIGQ